ncbi:MAG: hypothetical protein ACRDK2_04465 [Solirubrobacteraceae bacterium]
MSRAGQEDYQRPASNLHVRALWGLRPVTEPDELAALLNAAW